MLKPIKPRPNPKKKKGGSSGFPEGLNTLAHPSTLKDSELSEFINGVYSQYGSLSKRLGTTIIGNTAENATCINTVQDIYVGGATKHFRISDNGKPETYSFSNKTWSYFGGTAPVDYEGTSPSFDEDGVPTFDTTVKTFIKNVSGKIFFMNAVDQMVFWDNGQWYVYTELEDPTEYPTITKTGSGTGSTTWFYYFVYSNDVGGTLSTPVPNPEVQAELTGWIGDMPQELDTDTYLTVAVPTPPEGTKRVAVYRSTIQGVGFYVESIEPTQTTYVDKGQTNEDTFFPLPTKNDSGGVKFKMVDLFQERLIGVAADTGFTDEDDFLFWMAIDPKSVIGAPSSDPEKGGGYSSYRRGDGGKIRGIHAFVSSSENSLLVFKDSAFGKLQFIQATEGAITTQIQDINIAIGSLSMESLHIAGNNFRFWGRDGAGSVGHEENYGNLLRYSVLSLRADGITRQVTAKNLSEVCGVYYKNQSIFAISTQQQPGNNACLVYDERYNSWALWTNIYVKTFAKMISDIDQVERLYYGSNKTADVLEMFSGKTDYGTTGTNGEKITLSITTKQYDFKEPDAFKKLDKGVFVFGSLFGNNTTIGVTYADTKGVHILPRLRITMPVSSVGFGSNSWGNLMFGDSDGESVSMDNSIVRYINLKRKDMFWVKFNIQNDGLSDEVSLLGVFLHYTDSNRQLGHALRIKQLA